MRPLAALAVLAAVVAACFSERAGPVELGDDLDCSLPLDSLVIGNPGVVVIRDFAFHPAELRVPAGTRVTWVNCERESNGRAAHTSTADAGRWSSPLLAFQARYTTTLTEPGTFAYHCEPHPSMRGTVVVE